MIFIVFLSWLRCMPNSLQEVLVNMAEREQRNDQRDSSLFVHPPAGRESFFSIGSEHIDGVVTPPSDVPVTYGGVLQKIGRRLKLWSSRYFEIQGQQLYYYKNERKSRCLGVVDLKTCYNVEESNAANFGYAFKISTVNRDHTFAARSEEARKKWMEVIADQMGGKALHTASIPKKTKTGRRGRNQRNKTIDSVPQEAFETSSSSRETAQTQTPDQPKRRNRLSKLVTRIASFKKDERVARPHSYVAPETVHVHIDDPPLEKPKLQRQNDVVTVEVAQEPAVTTPPTISVREPTPPPVEITISPSKDAQEAPPTQDNTIKETPPTDDQVTKESPPTDDQVTKEAPPTDDHVTKEDTPPTDDQVTKEAPPTDDHVTKEDTPPTDDHVNKEAPPTDDHVTKEVTPPTDDRVNKEAPPTDDHVTKEVTPPTDDHVTKEAPPTDNHVTKEDAPPTNDHVTKEIPPDNHMTKETPPTDNHVIKETPPTDNHVTKETPPTEDSTGKQTAPADHVTSTVSTSTSTETGSKEEAPREPNNTAPVDTPTTEPKTTPTTVKIPPENTSHTVSPLAVHSHVRVSKDTPTASPVPPARKKKVSLSGKLPEIPSAPVLPADVRDYLNQSFAIDEMKEFLAALPDAEDTNPLPPRYQTLLSGEDEDVFPSMNELRHFLAECA